MKTPEEKEKKRLQYLQAAKKYQKTAKGIAVRKARRASLHGHEVEHNAYLQRKYGISIDDKKAKYKEQKGLCALCGEPLPDVIASHQDHNHLTGQIRGLVHKPCNWIIDLAEDRPHLISAAFKYLYKYGGAK